MVNKDMSKKTTCCKGNGAEIDSRQILEFQKNAII
jgi:hypothetical protein